MSALSLLKINSPFPTEEVDIKSPIITPSPNAAELFSPRYNIRRTSSSETPSSQATRRFGRKLSVPAVVQFPERKISYRLPTAMLHHIIQFVDFDKPSELCGLELVCRQFKKAMTLQFPAVKVAWDRMLIKHWGSVLPTHDELLCKLNSKHIYERRFLQTLVPVAETNRALTKLYSSVKSFQEIEFKEELDLVQKKIPAQSERGRIEHYLSTVKTGYALENVAEMERKSQTSPAFNPTLIRGLFSKNEVTVKDSVIQYRQMLSVVNGNPNIDIVISAKVVPQFIKLLRHAKDNVLKFEVTWVLTNICSGSSQNVAEVVNAGAIPFLVEAIYNESLPVDDIFIEQAIWALGNICGDSAAFCEKVIDHEPLPMLTDRLLKADMATLRMSFLRNTCWFLSNCVRSRPRMSFNKTRRICDVFGKTSRLSDLDVLCDTMWGVSYICEDIKEAEAVYLLERVTPQILLLMLQHNHGMVCTPAFHGVLHLIKACSYSRVTMIRAGLLETIAAIAKSRNGAGRVYRMCLDMFKTVQSFSGSEPEHYQGSEEVAAAWAYLESRMESSSEPASTQPSHNASQI